MWRFEVPTMRMAMEFQVIDDARWQAFRRQKLIGEGTESNVARDSVVSFFNPFGFDELRVAAGAESPGFGNAQSICIAD